MGGSGMPPFGGSGRSSRTIALELQLRPAGNLACDGKPVVARRLSDALAHVIFDALRVEVTRDKQNRPPTMAWLSSSHSNHAGEHTLESSSVTATVIPSGR